ncbi:hypothetical protein DL93DRAFT_2154699 [Clavulina sp. PMI_390]|nr:hypothetical protein DL93DRAFT_2154699 [Clavulina sp. PMI_390]
MASSANTPEVNANPQSINPHLDVSSSADATDKLESFTRSFLPELRAEIASYLPGKDLKSYSLVCHAFHVDAIRYLWRSVRVRSLHSQNSPDDFCRLMIKYPHRARLVKSFLFWYRDSPTEPIQHWIFKPDTAFWAHLTHALSLMSGVVRLDIMVITEGSICENPNPSALNHLYDAFTSAAFRDTLTHLSFDSPGDSVGFQRIKEIFPNLLTLVCYSSNRTNIYPASPDPSSFMHLQRTYGPTELLKALPRQSAVSKFKMTVSWLDIATCVRRLGRFARHVESLKHLNFSVLNVDRRDYAKVSPHLLSKLAHPKLESLTVQLGHLCGGSNPGLIAPMVLSQLYISGFLVPHSLTHLPSLQHLHITHVNPRIFQAIVMDHPHPGAKPTPYPAGQLNEEAIQVVMEALKERLEAEAGYPHPLQQIWIDCSQERLFPTGLMPRLRFSAERNGSGGTWFVQAKMVWCSEDVDGQLGRDFAYVRRFWERRI